MEQNEINDNEKFILDIDGTKVIISNLNFNDEESLLEYSLSTEEEITNELKEKVDRAIIEIIEKAISAYEESKK